MQPTVLFVDDEPMLLRAVARIFRGRFELHTAEDARRGLELLSGSACFDVLLVDFRMPRMYGRAFLDRARVIAPEAAQVVWTGDIDAERELRSCAEIFRVLLKPCPIYDLVRTVAAAAAGGACRQQPRAPAGDVNAARRCILPM